MPSSDAQQDAQEILIGCGAVSDCVDQLLRNRQAVLHEIALRNNAAVASVIAAIISPI